MNRETRTVDAWNEDAQYFHVVADVLSRNHMPVFTALYLACGLSNVLDALVARRTSIQGVMGARLDSLGDVFRFAAIFGSWS